MSHWYKAARCQEVINITIVVHKVAKNSFRLGSFRNIRIKEKNV